MQKIKTRCASGLAALCLGLACTPQPFSPELEHAEKQQDVVGGQTESGWQGVGALTMEISGLGYTGSFCTASLIAPQWLLTAAHCLDNPGGLILTADMVSFYVGPDANPISGDQRPSNGSFYQADGLYQHPQWDSTNVLNDIALVHLSESTGSLPTYAYNASSLDGSMVGESVFYVGYGVVEGINNTGGGVKRSASIDVSYVETDTYSGDYVSTGVCFGDSGGPGFYQFGGEWRIIGVNSTVGSGGADPCRGVYNHTRVDRFASWVASQLGQPPPNCQQDASVCPCAAACQSNGSCDNSLCETQTCREISDCTGACNSDSGCQSDCYLQGSSSARAAFNAMSQCLAEQCADLTGSAYQDCADQNCRSQIDTCIPRVTGNDACASVYDCIYACDQADTSCQNACRDNGTAQAQDTLNTMFACMNDACASITDNDAWQTCINENCGTQIEACFPPDNCDLRGGDCSGGQVCYPVRTGSTNCFDSQNVAVGESCTSDPESLTCVDGALCHVASSGSAGICIRFCYSDADCQGGDTCQIPYFEGLDGFGACLCDGETCGGSDGADAGVGSDAGGTGSGTGTSGRGANYGDGSSGGDNHTLALCSTGGRGAAWTWCLGLGLLLLRRRRIVKSA